MSKNIPHHIKAKVRLSAKNRCGYCLSPQHLVMGRLQIDHIIPSANGGSDDEANLWLACSICNGHKSDCDKIIDPMTNQIVPLFNPRTQNWFEHFKWSNDGLRVMGLTPIGWATVIALHLDTDADAIEVRRKSVSVVHCSFSYCRIGGVQRFSFAPHRCGKAKALHSKN